MDSAVKPNFMKGFVVRLLLFGVVILLLRFVYVVSIRGGSCASGEFCFFSSSAISLSGGFSGGGAAYVRFHDGSTVSPEIRKLWTSREWRKAVEFYSSLFQDLVVEDFLFQTAKSLCVGSVSGHEVLALKEIGVADSIGVSKKNFPPLVLSGDIFHLPFGNKTFDFVFSGNIMDLTSRPADLAGELVRVMKPNGFLVLITASAGDLYSLHSLEVLFGSCKMVRSREISSPDSSKFTREIVFRKEEASESRFPHKGDQMINDYQFIGGNSASKCHISDHKLQLLESAEPLLEEEPLKPWLTLKKNIQNIKYLPSLVDMSFKQRYVYIDVGARSYGSSIGSWFRKQYPKQNKTFEIYAIEADRAFHAEYASKKGINYLPYAAWIRNESISFEVSHDHDQKSDEKGSGMGRIKAAGASSHSPSADNLHMIQGFDFAEWLKNTVTEKDFVVVKMDVEGTEFDLVPRLFETGAICLIDELFLECHYNRWQRCCPGKRSPKYQNTYGQCIHLFSSLRQNGVLVHQWW